MITTAACRAAMRASQARVWEQGGQLQRRTTSCKHASSSMQVARCPAELH